MNNQTNRKWIAFRKWQIKKNFHWYSLWKSWHNISSSSVFYPFFRFDLSELFAYPVRRWFLSKSTTFQLIKFFFSVVCFQFIVDNRSSIHFDFAIYCILTLLCIFIRCTYFSVTFRWMCVCACAWRFEVNSYILMLHQHFGAFWMYFTSFPSSTTLATARTAWKIPICKCIRPFIEIYSMVFFLHFCFIELIESMF